MFFIAVKDTQLLVQMWRTLECDISKPIVTASEVTQRIKCCNYCNALGIVISLIELQKIFHQFIMFQKIRQQFVGATVAAFTEHVESADARRS